MVDTVDAGAAALEGRERDQARADAVSDGEIPARVGRYVIVDQIGRGGMGIVFAAYDPELDRKVAIKLLDPQREDIAARVRLLREAQAMARLQHPNVVAVHDVGTFGDRVFVAMEFVRGRTLGAHLARAQRPWTEVLALLVAAGRGLAAAHEVGLVHRDFKPDNVLVSDSGRVQVGDFGLARAAEGTLTEDDDSVRSAPRSSAGRAASLVVTRTGAMLGTPAYMAPEQHARGRTDARTDQFAFCVAAYEALYGARAFAGTTVSDIATAVLTGEVRPIPRTSRIPLAIGRALLRGLSIDPNGRWPDMNVLLTRLEGAPRRARMRWTVTLVGAAVIGTLAVARSVGRGAPDCADAPELRSRLWNEVRREEAERAVLATAVAYAADTWERVDRSIDGHVGAWATSRAELCRAHLELEVSDELFDRKMTCLAQRQSEVDALVEVLAHSDATTIANAVTAASQLTPPGTCDDPERSRTNVDPPQASAITQVADLRARLDGARVTADAGRLADARAAIEAAATEADDLAYRPLTAEAQLRLGWVYDRSGDYRAAEGSLTHAWFEALASGHEQVAADAAADLVLVLGVRQTRFDEALAWARNAEALLARRTEDTALAARYHANLGNLFGKRGDNTRAISELRTAVALEEERLGRESPGVARQITSLGLALLRAGEYEGARGELERARDIQVRVLGPEHPDVATTLNNLGGVLARQGRYTEARAEHEKALAIRVAALGPDHPDTASSHTNLGIALRHLGEWDEASRHLEQAVEIKTRAMGSDDPQVADALTNLGNLHFAREDFAAAADAYQRALAIYSASLGPAHPDVGASLNNIGIVQWKRGELEAAESTLTRALGLWERALGPDHPDLAATLLGLGEVALARGSTDVATERLERALAVLRHAAPSDDVLADVRFALARTIVAREPTRAYALAEQAASTYLAQGRGSRARRERVERFLEHRHESVKARP